MEKGRALKVYRMKGQTKFKVDGVEGLLTLHDSGKIGVSVDLKSLFNGLQYEIELSYFAIRKPTTREREVIFDRLFSLTA